MDGHKDEIVRCLSVNVQVEISTSKIDSYVKW